MKKLVVAALCLCVLPLTAVLPPVWQNVAELKAILTDPALNQELDSAELIQSINRIENGWEIRTNKQTVIAEITPQPQSMPGPERFKVTFKKR